MYFLFFMFETSVKTFLWLFFTLIRKLVFLYLCSNPEKNDRLKNLKMHLQMILFLLIAGGLHVCCQIL